MGQEWFVAQSDKKLGPFSSKNLKELASHGRLQPTDLVWTEGMSKWKEARNIKGLFPNVPETHQQRVRPTPPPLPSGNIPVATVLPAEAGSDSLPAAQPVGAKNPSWLNRMASKKWVRVAVAVVALFVLVGRVARLFSSGTGTITFAESVDQRTLKTTNEGTRFSMGWVWMVIRGKKSFGDTRLILYGRLHGTEAWAVLSEETIDPSWDVAVEREFLDVPGTFDVKAMTSKGSLVAQSTVEISGR